MVIFQFAFCTFTIHLLVFSWEGIIILDPSGDGATPSVHLGVQPVSEAKLSPEQARQAGGPRPLKWL